ncbi:coatomer subunit beta isoform X3 [Nymphalis io]|uniref:coatomer subunit beta isoform X3 n=1 Tax=Inachis io TaxID=171585 RepID=UPI0021695147|nr:coatomer subunit beta isoform X3 [Nymphalis io]
MAGVEQPCYTLINFPTDSEPHNEMQLKLDLEKGDIKKKIEALKKTISIILSGEKIPGLLMIIIRFVLPLQDHTIKKLLLIFWEIVPKTSPDGKLLQEMILVCDAYRKDLQHPNEFIRGSTLRFLCKLKEPELLEPLMPAIRACLDHRHSYVRRNAVLAIFTIYRNFEFLIPDAPELVGTFLEGEQDMSCKRNAFLMLLHAEQERALAYLADRLDHVHAFGDILQLVIVELIYKVCHANPSERSRFIRTVYGLLNAPSAAVRYEAAGTLITLSCAPAAIKAAAACYIDLIVKESDNNVKLIVVGRLSALRAASGDAGARALPDLAMDVLRVLAASDLDVRRHTLHLALELVGSRHAEELVGALRKEAARAQLADHDDADKYRQLLVRAMHRAALKFPEVAGTVAPALLEMLGDGSEAAAADVLLFLRHALHAFPDLRPRIYSKLLEVVSGIRVGKIARPALWLVAEFAESADSARAALDVLGAALPPLAAPRAVSTAQSPRRGRGASLLLTDHSQEEEAAQDGASVKEKEPPARQLVTSDGAYATQSAFNLPKAPTATDSKTGGLSSALREGESFTAACACSALAKLALRVQEPALANRALHLAASLLAYHKTNKGAAGLTADDAQHGATCVRAAAARPRVAREALLHASRRALHALLALPERAAPALLPDCEAERSARAAERVSRRAEVECGITFAALAGAAAAQHHDIFEVSLSKALQGRSTTSSERGKLSKVTQLTGFSDPVYAEAIVAVNQYDIVLDVLVVNQTDDTLQNCTVELATLGELRLVERPAGVVLAPRDFASIRAHVKVASTENGIIFGNIVYEVSGAGTDRGVVVLNDIHIDIVDYIQPAVCSDADFRHMWAEFEWENKVSVNTNITDLREYLQHLLASTNMKCLTPDKALSGQCGFMAANLYARSIFGEDALANLSIETPLQRVGAPVVGHVRIRAKTQGMALSLGDKINMMQKSPPKLTEPTVAA